MQAKNSIDTDAFWKEMVKQLEQCFNLKLILSVKEIDVNVLLMLAEKLVLWNFFTITCWSDCIQLTCGLILFNLIRFVCS